MYQNGGIGNFFIHSGNTQDHNLFDTDLLFTDATSGDFTLRPTSPAIDGEFALGAPSCDYDNYGGPQGADYDDCDIGACEFVGFSGFTRFCHLLLRQHIFYSRLT